MNGDEAVLRFLNERIANPFLDAPMVVASLVGTFVPFALFGWAAWRNGYRWPAVAFFLAILLAEVAVMGIKPWIGRPRPEGARLVLQIAGEYGMPSGHAARAFAGATALAGIGPRTRHAMFSLAVVISVSRIYVGAHYPSDVVAGAALGTSIGLLSLYFVRKAKAPRRASFSAGAVSGSKP